MNIEDNVKESVINALKPTVKDFQGKVTNDLKKLVREEVSEAIRPFQEHIMNQEKREVSNSLDVNSSHSSKNSESIPSPQDTLEEEDENKLKSPEKEKPRPKSKTISNKIEPSIY